MKRNEQKPVKQDEPTAKTGNITRQKYPLIGRVVGQPKHDSRRDPGQYGQIEFWKSESKQAARDKGNQESRAEFRKGHFARVEVPLLVRSEQVISGRVLQVAFCL
jgi:hypothetical protein